jgi:hypothetical protein
MTPEILEHVEHLFREKGSDCWWELDIKDLMPPGAFRDAADEYTKVDCVGYLLLGCSVISVSFFVCMLTLLRLWLVCTFV